MINREKKNTTDRKVGHVFNFSKTNKKISRDQRKNFEFCE